MNNVQIKHICSSPDCIEELCKMLQATIKDAAAHYESSMDKLQKICDETDVHIKSLNSFKSPIDCNNFNFENYSNAAIKVISGCVQGIILAQEYREIAKIGKLVEDESFLIINQFYKRHNLPMDDINEILGRSKKEGKQEEAHS